MNYALSFVNWLRYPSDRACSRTTCTLRARGLGCLANFQNISRNGSPLCLIFALAACALAQPRPADTLYVLHADVPAPAGKPLPFSLMIALPDAGPGLDTPRIAVLDTPNHLTYYTGAAWAQPLPQTLQAFLSDSLQQSHRFKSVSSDQGGVFADLILLTEIRDYEVENNGNAAPTVRLRLGIKLVEGNTHHIVASFSIEKTAAAQANHMADIVAAFNAATQEAAADIADGIATACKRKSGGCAQH